MLSQQDFAVEAYDEAKYSGACTRPPVDVVRTWPVAEIVTFLYTNRNIWYIDHLSISCGLQPRERPASGGGAALCRCFPLPGAAHEHPYLGLRSHDGIRTTICFSVPRTRIADFTWPGAMTETAMRASMRVPSGPYIPPSPMVA